MAERVQLRRSKGWRLPENTVVVSRPSKWGNPFRVGKSYPCVEGDLGGARRGKARIADARDAVSAFRSWACDESEPLGDLGALRGKNLACWCAPDSPCHADVLLELAAGDG